MRRLIKQLIPTVKRHALAKAILNCTFTPLHQSELFNLKQPLRAKELSNEIESENIEALLINKRIMYQR